MILYYYLKIFHKQFISVLKHDVYSVYSSFDEKITINAIKSNLEFRILFYFRASKYFGKKKIFASYIYKYYKKLSSKYCITLNPETKIGFGFRIGHIGNIIIHSKSIIGNNVTISQGVTIGKIHTGKKSGTPKLGNRIYVGPNAVVVGNINIGNDVVIAGNAFVNFDVPDNSVVVGNPSVIHYKENPTLNILNIFFDNEHLTIN